MLRFPPKVVCILCILQVMMIIAAVLICRAMVKYYTTALVPHFGDMPDRFNGMLNFFLFVGPWMLLVPMIWGGIATAMADAECRVPQITPLQTKVGYCVTLFIVVVCLFSSRRAMQAAFDPIPMSRMARLDMSVWNP